jgi:peptidoglycan LD-endopeptidase CwlK
MYSLNSHSKKRLEGVHPLLIDVIEEAIVGSPYNFQIPRDGGVRTVERQQELYSYGRTNMSKKKVTNVDGIKKKSNHQVKADGYGHAFDIFIMLPNGKASWDKKMLTEVANHILAIGKTKGVTIEWGGNWTKFPDLPHFELK